MSIFTKGPLKALKEALAKKDWPNVERNASTVLDYESSHYQARVFLALALFNLDKPDEAEESYKKAIEQSPNQPLARQGLASFYEKRQRWTDYARELQGLMQLFEESQDAPQYAESLEKLLDVRRTHGTKEEVISTLSLLLPSSPVHPLLLSLPPWNATMPTATSYPTIQQAIATPLPTLLELISLIQSLETATLESEIKKRRQRLGGPAMTAEETRRQVQAEQMPTSQLPGLWRAVLEDPDAANDEALRRDLERQLLVHLSTTLRSLPSPFDALTVHLSVKAKKETTEQEVEKEVEAKRYCREQVEGLAKGMVLINVLEPLAWEIALEWGDKFGGETEGWSKERWDELRRLAELFPESGTGHIAVAAHQRLLAARATSAATTAPEGEDVEIPSAPSEVEMAQTVEDGLAKSPSSLVAHLVAAAFFRSQQEWEALAQVAEAGLSILGRIRTDVGRELPSSRRTLETHLALALVYNVPPTHHLRALRLLESLLAAPPLASTTASAASHLNPEILTAKAFVLQSSEKYAAALKVWDQLLGLPSGALSSDALTQTKSERAWALHLSGESKQAIEELRGVVEKLEDRKVRREKEREEKEKWRSKKGLEKPEGVEEGEREEEREERAKGWWRLGECLWKLGDSSVDLATEAYDAYIASLRALPSYAPAFTSLGLYYRSLATPDWERASKCFQKAFELDPGQEVAAKYLAEEFAELGEWSLVEVIARRVVEGNKGKIGMGGKAAKRLAWAWKAIGGSELNSKKYPQAITAFQAALRGSPDDLSTWLKLGTAYRQSGKHIAALKVFVKALDLDPTSWFAKYAIADVQREIGLVEPAIKTLKEILADRPDELGVKVVLAETSLAKGLDEQRRGFVVRAEESLTEALREATAIVQGGTATRVAWKIAAETLVGLGKIPESEHADQWTPFVETLLGHLAEQGVDGKIAGMTTVTVATMQKVKDDASAYVLAVAVSVLAFKMRVLLETQNEAAIGSAWFDLGVAISNFRPHLSSFSSSGVDSEQALQQAIKCLKYALHKEPLNSTFWNALGVLSFDLSPRLAQHCFIRSVEHNSRTAVPWTNLGLFYLVHGDEDLANQAFLKAQVLDSEWTAAWIGQATLADMAGHAVEAAVLLEHAFTLPNTSPEADYSYASRAFVKYKASIPSSSSSVAQSLATSTPSATEALSAPLFSLTRYLTQKPADHHAVHLSALMLEQVGDLESACSAFEKAASLLEELYEVDESPEVEGQYVIAQTNLGRVRLAAKNYDGALEAFEAALSLLNIEEAAEQPTNGGLSKEQTILLVTECRLGTAMGQFWSDDAHGAKETLELAKEEVDGSLGGTVGDHLAAASARVYWAEGDEDRALAALMDAPDQYNKSSSPLFLKRIVQAYAVASNDAVILEGTSKFTLDANVKHDPEIARLTVLQHLLKNDPSSALFGVSRALHAFPWATSSRSRIAYLLCTLPTFSSLDNSQLNDEVSTSENLDIAERLIRPRVPPQAGAEDAVARSLRARVLGLIALAKEGEIEGEEQVDVEAEALRWFEKALFAAPWEQKARSKWETASAALRKVYPTVSSTSTCVMASQPGHYPPRYRLEGRSRPNALIPRENADGIDEHHLPHADPPASFRLPYEIEQPRPENIEPLPSLVTSLEQLEGLYGEVGIQRELWPSISGLRLPEVIQNFARTFIMHMYVDTPGLERIANYVRLYRIHPWLFTIRSGTGIANDPFIVSVPAPAFPVTLSGRDWVFSPVASNTHYFPGPAPLTALGPSSRPFRPRQLVKFDRGEYGGGTGDPANSRTLDSGTTLKSGSIRA
ncbi:hypothetical protein JCM11641_006210 [Rhodosporidiobolus odoratus]